MGFKHIYYFTYLLIYFLKKHLLNEGSREIEFAYYLLNNPRMNMKKLLEAHLGQTKKYTCLGLPDRPDVFYSIFADPILFFALGSGKNILDVFFYFLLDTIHLNQY